MNYTVVMGDDKAIDAFVKDVEKVGQPDIDGGDKVIKAVRSHAKERKDILSGMKKDVNKLDDDDDEESAEIIVADANTRAVDLNVRPRE